MEIVEALINTKKDYWEYTPEAVNLIFEEGINNAIGCYAQIFIRPEIKGVMFIKPCPRKAPFSHRITDSAKKPISTIITKRTWLRYFPEIIWEKFPDSYEIVAQKYKSNEFPGITAIMLLRQKKTNEIGLEKKKAQK